jgi:cytoskeletal protein RodZ
MNTTTPSLRERRHRLGLSLRAISEETSLNLKTVWSADNGAQVHRSTAKLIEDALRRLEDEARP